MYDKELMKALSASQAIRLFLGTFSSALLLLGGGGTLWLSFWPVLAEKLTPAVAYWPQLPLSADRDEPLLDINSFPATQLYPPLSPSEQVEPGSWIRIPSIGVNVPLAQAPSISDADIIATLNHGAALYPNGILPGRLGNVFISAHSTGDPWRGKYRFAFLKINEIEPGNLIHLDYQGTRYTYRVVNSQTVTPDPDYRVVSDRPVPTVTLMACWPLWSTSQRLLVRAELTNITFSGGARI